MTIMNQDTGWVRDAANPVLSTRHWDDLVQYAATPIHVGGSEYVFYAGASDHRWHMSIGLAINGLKQGIVIDRASVGYGGANKGIMPFDVIEIGGVYWMLLVAFNGATGLYRICTMRSADLVSWSSFADTGIDGHGPCWMEDPADSSKLIIYFTQMGGASMYIRRATATKANPSAMTVTGTVLSESGVNLIYPRSIWNGAFYEMLFAKQFASSPVRYRIYKSASRDGLSFPASGLIALPNGASGSFDEGYATVPRLSDGKLYWSGRKLNEADLYQGIGRADWSAIGSLASWDYGGGSISASTDYVHSGSHGIKMVGGAQSPFVAKIGEGKDKRYSARIYDTMITTANFQNTWRLFESGGADVLIGLWMGASTSKYVYRTKGGAWTATGINRSAGWHELTFEVDASEVRMKIDGTLVATDTAFNVNDIDRAVLQGYSAGTGYADSCEISAL